jgi:hypothetical protein
MIARSAAALALASAIAGCTARDTVATLDGGDIDQATYCSQEGAPVLVDDTCTGALAADLFRHAVCGCDSLFFDPAFTADGYDSTGNYLAGGSDGHVGSNRGLDGNETMSMTGNLTVGPDGIEAGVMLEVGGDLESGGLLGRPTSTIEVRGAARVAGDVNVQTLSVATLVTRAGATVTGTINGAVEEQAEINVAEPCICDENRIDVAAIVAEHELANHNEEAAIAQDRLRDIDGSDRLELPCGRFYLEEISGDTAGSITILVGGRTALFVGGNITLTQDLIVDLEPGAELDLFVRGSIQVKGALRLGELARPRSLRMYAASGGAIRLEPGSALAANLFAPQADLTTEEPLEVFGALVVHRVVAAKAVKLHFDKAIERARGTCPD